MALPTWPESERPRERFIAEGPQNLSDAELIALILHTGVRGRSTVDLARSLLAEYGGLANLLGADSERCCTRRVLAPPRRLGSASSVNCPTAISPSVSLRAMCSKIRPKPETIFVPATATARVKYSAVCFSLISIILSNSRICSPVR